MREVQLEYNSERERLIIPEYGRNIQKLISHAKTIEDAELRQAFVERVIHLMMQMHPKTVVSMIIGKGYGNMFSELLIMISRSPFQMASL